MDGMTINHIVSIDHGSYVGSRILFGMICGSYEYHIYDIIILYICMCTCIYIYICMIIMKCEFSLFPF